MASDPRKVRQHQERTRVLALSHLFDPDPEQQNSSDNNQFDFQGGDNCVKFISEILASLRVTAVHKSHVSHDCDGRQYQCNEEPYQCISAEKRSAG